VHTIADTVCALVQETRKSQEHVKGMHESFSINRVVGLKRHQEFEELKLEQRKLAGAGEQQQGGQEVLRVKDNATQKSQRETLNALLQVFSHSS
jgi:hypothetical protein